jgi:DNA-binding transcriptional regulator PaaX
MATRFRGIKTAAEYRRGELVRDILRLVGAGLAGTAVLVAPNTAQLIEYFVPNSPRERNRIWKAIKYLEQKNRIVLEEKGAHTYVTITAQGRLRLNEDTIWELTIDTPRRWDHKWHIVMFDLPAQYEKKRQSFRLKLEDMGLRQYQRSVYIYPHDCHEEVLTVAKWYGVERFIRYIVATEINDMRDFVHAFGLLDDR